jgi:hypothetical protein
MRSLWGRSDAAKASTRWHVGEKWFDAPRAVKWIWCLKWTVFPAPFKKMSGIKIPDSSYA